MLFSNNKSDLIKARDLLYRANGYYVIINTIFCEGLGVIYINRILDKFTIKYSYSLPQIYYMLEAGFPKGFSKKDLRTLKKIREFYKFLAFWRKKSYKLFLKLGATGKKFNKILSRVENKILKNTN
jgi:hypothetical protein